MDKTEQYAQWIVNNADKRGTDEFNAVVAAYEASKGVKEVSGYVKSISGTAPDSVLQGGPTAGMSGPQKFLAGTGKAFVDVGRGVADMFAGAPSPEAYSGGLDVGVQIKQEAQQAIESDIAESRELDKPLMETGAGLAGNVFGNVAAFAPTAMIPGANTYKGAALTGAAVGALQPTTEDESRLGNTASGAALGVAGRAGFDLGAAGLGRARNAISPYFRPERAAGRALDEAAGSRQQAIIRALRGNRNPLSTSGEAAAPVGSAEFSGLQRLASRQRPSESVSLANRQATARTNALRGALGSSDDLPALMSNRASVTNPLYTAAKESDAVVDVSRVRNLVDRLIDQDPKNSTLMAALNKVKADILDDGSLITNPRELISASKEVGNEMSKKGPTGAKVNENIVRELRVIKRFIDHQISKVVPDYKQATSAYAELSRPIDQANIGQVLLDSIDPALRDFGGDVGQRATSYANAVRNAPQTVSRATGFRRSPSLESALTGDQMRAVTGVAEDLANQSNFNTLAREGLKSAGEVMEGVQPGQLPGILERNVVIANALLGRTGKAGSKRIMEYLAEHMQDPQTIARIMESSSSNEALQRMIQALRTTAPIMSAQGI